MSIPDILEPYREHDLRLREVFAQQPDHPAISESHYVPLFSGHESDVKTRARDLDSESEDESQRYIMPLDKNSRRADGTPAIVQSLKEFQTNFSIFTESSLADMDWSNVAAAGSSVLTSLLPVPDKYATSKRALRQYYHEKIAPASDVDLYLYDLTEEQAKEKVKQIEQSIRDSILTETTTVRTKNAITIASQYPNRHVQVVLRIYRSITEMLLGFDVDCSCIAYDGKQLFASPRALAACMTQVNTIDLTRRSPSYENRLAKYSHRGFEVCWPPLDRSRIDPTIFERSFKRTHGLARLLVLERLPKVSDRDAYVDKRRAERGRPKIDRDRYELKGNIKDQHDEEVADFVDEEEVSNYHTFAIPYGPLYTARKIEKLLYRKDLLLNAEWNRSKDREVHLHRHPAFFGRVEDVLQDCCGYCPKPLTSEEEEVAEKESKIFISGPTTFLKDNPGRQAIGSFHPLTADDWTEMGYIGSTSVLCQAIIDHDLEQVRDWLSQEGTDPNCRDHTGRTPLQLAVISSTVEIVQCLIDGGARIVARMVDGKTALHLAAIRGSVEMVSALLGKSEENEEVEADKACEQALRLKMKKLQASADTTEIDVQDDGSDIEFVQKMDDGLTTATTDRSFVKVTSENRDDERLSMPDEIDDNEPDIYDVGVVAWDVPLSTLHLAIAHGHVNVVKALVQEFGANPAQPFKLLSERYGTPLASILPMAIALMLPLEQAKLMTKLLIDLGASPSQGDFDGVSVLHLFAVNNHELFKSLLGMSQSIAARALNHVAVSGYHWDPRMSTPLCSAVLQGNEAAVRDILEIGVAPQIEFAAFSRSFQRKFEDNVTNSVVASQNNKDFFNTQFAQPVITAAECELPELVGELLKYGADINTLTKDGWEAILAVNSPPQKRGTTLLDLVRDKKDELKCYMERPTEKRPARSWDILKPLPLEDDDVYVRGLTPGTYAYWSTAKQVGRAKARYKAQLKTYEKQEKDKDVAPKNQERFDAVCILYDRFVSLEAELLENDAKTFKELHADAREPRKDTRDVSPQRSLAAAKTWSPSISFQSPDAADDRKVAYLELFQACWDGHDETINRLALNVWKNDQRPLKVDVCDRNDFTPFAICIFRQHYQTAGIVLEIARTQHDYKIQSDKSRFTTRAADDIGDDDGPVSDDEHLGVVTENVDNEFTTDSIGEVQTQARGDCSPLQLLTLEMPVSDFLECNTVPGESAATCAIPALTHPASLWTPHPDLKTCQPDNLFEFAIFQDDLNLMSLLLDLAEKYHEHESGEAHEFPSTFYQFPEDGFHLAISLGRTRILSEIISRTGCGFPLDEFVKRSGIKIQSTSQHYQGLSIHGEKRADWAQAGRDVQQTSNLSKHPPLLHAARSGNVVSIEWLRSDEPKKCYAKFATVNQEDKRMKSLARSSGDLLATINQWLDKNAHLLLHCVILTGTKPDSLRLLEHLIKREPSLLEAKSLNGQSPLHLAFSLHRTGIAKLLVSAGADQTTRNKNGDNLIHAILRRDNCDPRIKPDLLKELLSIIEPRLLPTLFTELSSSEPGSVTPLAHWLALRGRNTRVWDSFKQQQRNVEILSIILSFSKGVSLDIVNGAGETPLHDTVKRTQIDMMRVILEYRPELLYREDATGRTPYEIARDAHFAKTFAHAPDVPGVRIRKHAHIFKGDDERVALLNRSEESFKPFDLRSDEEKAWDMCKDFDRKAEFGKRKLVTLYEANEVMKRIAARKPKSQSGHDTSGKVVEEPKDEVDVWYC